MCISWLQYPTCNRSIRFISYSMSWRRRMNFSVWSRAPVRRARPTPAAPRRYVTPCPQGPLSPSASWRPSSPNSRSWRRRTCPWDQRCVMGSGWRFWSVRVLWKCDLIFCLNFHRPVTWRRRPSLMRWKNSSWWTTALKSYVSICVDFQAPNQVKPSLYTVCTGVCLQKQHHKPN